jgi:hypothetical protein
MRPHSISRRYLQLQAEIRTLMSSSKTWRCLPAMLDELDLLRAQYHAARRSLDSLTEESERLAFQPALH